MSNGHSTRIPRKRADDLVVRAHGEETLVLDRRPGTVHCLPAEVTRVWHACTGSNTLAEVASAARTDERTAAAAVDQLLLLDLLESHPGFDRRKFLRRSAMVGASVAVIPVIESVVAPTAAWAQSKPGQFTFEATCVTTSGQMQWAVTFPENSGWNPGTQYAITAAVENGPSSMGAITPDPSGAGTTGPVNIGTPGELQTAGTPVALTITNTTNPQDTFTFHEVLAPACPAPGGQFVGVGLATVKRSSGNSAPANDIFYPERTLAGDLVIVVVITGQGSSSTITAPATWNLIARLGAGSPNRTVAAFWKIAAQGETFARFTSIQADSAGGAAAWAVVYRNLTAPSGTAASGSAGATQTMTPGLPSGMANGATVISMVTLRGPGAFFPINAPTLSMPQGFALNVSTTAGGGTSVAPTAGNSFLGLGTASRFAATAGSVTPPTWSQQGTETNLAAWTWITAAFT